MRQSTPPLPSGCVRAASFCEGGLFVIVSNLITVFKYLLLQFLPKAFASLPVVDSIWTMGIRLSRPG